MNEYKVMLEKIDVTNMTTLELRSKLDSEYKVREDFEYIFKITNKELKFKASNIEFTYDIESTIRQIELEKESNQNNDFKNSGTRNFKIKYTYNEELLRKLYDNVLSDLKKEFKEQLEINEEDGKIIINKNAQNIVLDYEEFKKNIISVYLSEINRLENEIKVANQIANEVDINKIITGIKRDSKNAYIDINTNEIIPEVNGIRLEKTDEEIIKDYEKNTNETFKFRYFLVVPEITKKKLEEDRKNQGIIKVGTDIIYERTYKLQDSVDTNTIRNIENSVSKLNGKVINTGEIFSFKTNIGPLLENNGFVKGIEFKNGQKTEEIAGGINFVSSSIYDLVLRTGFEIVSRNSKNLSSIYFENGFDADITKGDLIFRNTQGSPVKLELRYASYTLNVKIIGTKDPNKKVIVEKSDSNIIKFKSILKPNESFSKNQRQVYQKGLNGMSSKVTRKIIIGTNEIVENVSNDFYDVLDEIIEVSKDENSYINI